MVIVNKKIYILIVIMGSIFMVNVTIMASVTYGKCIVASVIMANVNMEKVLLQMKLSRIIVLT